MIIIINDIQIKEIHIKQELKINSLHTRLFFTEKVLWLSDAWRRCPQSLPAHWRI
jgi:hypothetical protein